MSDTPQQRPHLHMLYVDDEEDILSSFELNVEDYWKTTLVQDPEDIYSGKVSLNGLDAALVDLIFERHIRGVVSDETSLEAIRKKGYDLITCLRREQPHLPIIIISATMTRTLTFQLKERFGRVLCFAKPLKFDDDFRRTIEDFISV